MRQNVFAAGLWGSGIRMELWKGLVRNGGEEKDGDGKREGKGNWNWGLFVSLDLGGQTPLSVYLSVYLPLCHRLVYWRRFHGNDDVIDCSCLLGYFSMHGGAGEANKFVWNYHFLLNENLFAAENVDVAPIGLICLKMSLMKECF